MKGSRLSVLSVVGALALTTGLTACAARQVVMVPAPNATIASAPQFQGAEGQADGVKIIAAANEWNGRPGNLDKKVTPVRIRIVNHSGHPLQVSYSDFELKVPNSNRAFMDLPPVDIAGSAYYGALREPAWQKAKLVNTAFEEDEEGGGDDEIVPDFDYGGFYSAPYWNYGYVGLNPWPYAWAPAYGYYNQWYPYMSRVHLPTKSMLRKGIPEGVVSNGGHIGGFLYFQKVGHVSDVNLRVKLIDAKTGKQFGTIMIPFVIRG